MAKGDKITKFFVAEFGRKTAEAYDLGRLTQSVGATVIQFTISPGDNYETPVEPKELIGGLWLPDSSYLHFVNVNQELATANNDLANLVSQFGMGPESYAAGMLYYVDGEDGHWPFFRLTYKHSKIAEDAGLLRQVEMDYRVIFDKDY